MDEEEIELMILYAGSFTAELEVEDKEQKEQEEKERLEVLDTLIKSK